MPTPMLRSPRTASRLAVAGLLTGTLVTSGLSACSSEPEASLPEPGEITSIPGLSLDERSLTAEVARDRATIRLPLAHSGAGSVRGIARIDIVDISGDADVIRGSAQAAFEAARPDDHVTLPVAVRGLDASGDRAGLAKYVIRYELRTATGRLRGARDLWVALPKAELQLLAPAELPAGGSTFARVFARDAATGRALAGATIELSYTPEGGAATTLASGLTDEHGGLSLALPGPDEVGAGELAASLTAGALSARAARAVRVARSQAILLATDKPMYQPGQLVHLRALALSRTDRAPAGGRAVTFEVRDAKGNKVFRTTRTANDFGIASARLPLANQVNFGTWRIRATVEGSEAETTIQVERYSLPKFEVTVEADRSWYHPGDVVRGSVRARYFFGRSVQGGLDVAANLTDAAGEREIARVSGVLDADGGFSFELPLPGQVQAGSAPPRIALVAHVRDSAGQEVDGSRTLPLSVGELQLAVLPEGRLAAGVANRYLAAVTDPVGVPVPATLEIDGVGTVTIDESGIGSFEAVPAEDGSLHVTARAADGRTAEQDFELGAPAAQALVLRSDKAVYQVGDVARLSVVAVGDAPARIALDVGKSGRPLATRDLTLVSGRGELELAIGPELAGALALEASYAGPGGVLVSDARTVFVDAKDALQVELRAPGSVKPGEPTQVELQVRDADGVGIPAAVGVSIVDPAVLALAGGRPAADPADLAFDGRAPAPVAGHALSEVLGGTGAAREAAARLLFAAAGGGAAYGIDANTYREELAGVKTIVKTRFDRTRADMLVVLQADARLGLVTDENAMRFLATRASEQVDVFGQLLSVTPKDAYTATLTSRGPDEVAGSADDLSADVSVWEFAYGNGYYGGRGDEADMDGAGPMAGGAAGEDGNMPPASPDDGATQGGGAAASRVRSWFPETLLVEPSVITDERGQATLSFPVADSITTWKIAASASSRQGQLGSATGDLRVFQDFFVDLSLPPTLTKGDELSIPVAVYNYRPDAQTVQLDVEAENWFALLDSPTKTLTLGPGEVRGTSFRIRAVGVGSKGITVRATAGGVSDAVRRDLLVEPGGERIEAGRSDKLTTAGGIANIAFPGAAIGGGNKLMVRLYAGVMAQTVEGTEAIVQEPNGCFEQSTSSTWPDIMVGHYRKANGGGGEDDELYQKVVTYVQKGYQLLLTFESPQGGFNWFGENAPGNKILTALGILIFRDMEGLIEVDEDVVVRHASWLAGEQLGDGSWAKGDALHMGNEFLSEDEAIVTSFAVQALAAAGGHEANVERGLAYLAGRVGRGIDASFTLALVAKTLAQSNHPSANQALSSLYDLAVVDAEGRFGWAGPDNASWTGATGENAGVETTAMAAQAFLVSGSYPDAAEGALRQLAASKNALGVWSQTQATVQALRAFTMSASSSRADVEGDVQILVDGQPAGTIHVTPADSDIVRLVDLGEYAGTGDHEISLQLVGRGQLLYQVAGTHHLAWDGPRPGGGLEVTVAHSATELAVGESAQLQLHLANTNSDGVEQVLVKVGLAPGMEARSGELDALVAQGTLSRWERSSTGVVLYVPQLAAGQALDLQLVEVANLAVRAEAPATLAYAYYNPDQKAVAPPVAFQVVEAP